MRRIYSHDWLSVCVKKNWQGQEDGADVSGPLFENAMKAGFRFYGDEIGFFAFNQIGMAEWQIHLCRRRSNENFAAFREAIRILRQGTNCDKVTGKVPFDLPLVKRFAMRCGMAVEGVDRKSYRRGDELLDQWHMGITKEEIDRWASARQSA